MWCVTVVSSRIFEVIIEYAGETLTYSQTHFSSGDYFPRCPGYSRGRLFKP